MLRNPAAVFERADEMAAQFRALMKEAEAAAREGEGSCSGCCCCCSGGRGGGGVKEDFEFWSFFFLASNFVFQLFESEHYALRERERTGRISKQQRESVRHFL